MPVDPRFFTCQEQEDAANQDLGNPFQEVLPEEDPSGEETGITGTPTETSSSIQVDPASSSAASESWFNPLYGLFLLPVLAIPVYLFFFRKKHSSGKVSLMKHKPGERKTRRYREKVRPQFDDNSTPALKRADSAAPQLVPPPKTATVRPDESALEMAMAETETLDAAVSDTIIREGYQDDPSDKAGKGSESESNIWRTSPDESDENDSASTAAEELACLDTSYDDETIDFGLSDDKGLQEFRFDDENEISTDRSSGEEPVFANEGSLAEESTLTDQPVSHQYTPNVFESIPVAKTPEMTSRVTHEEALPLSAVALDRPATDAPASQPENNEGPQDISVAEWKALEERNDELEKETAQLREQLDLENSKLPELESELEELQDRLTAAESERKDLQTQVASANSRLESASREIEVARAGIPEVAEKQWQKKLESLEEELREQQACNQSMTDELAAVHQELVRDDSEDDSGTLAKKLEYKSDKLARVKAKLRKKLDLIDELRQEVASVREELVATREHADRHSGTDGENRILADEVARLKSQLNLAESRNTENGEIEESRKKEVDELRATVETQKNQLASVLKELEVAERELDELRAIAEQTTTAKINYEKADAENQRLKREVRSLKDAAASAESTFQQRLAKHGEEVLANHIAENPAVDVSIYEQKIVTLSSDNEILTTQVAEAVRDVEKQSRTISRMESARKKLKNELEVAREESGKSEILEQEIVELDSRTKKQARKIARLERKIKTLETGTTKSRPSKKTAQSKKKAVGKTAKKKTAVAQAKKSTRKKAASKTTTRKKKTTRKKA